jgi:tyrosyl-tRNA synthetase
MMESIGEKVEEVYGQTTPLLVNSRGEKIGKSTGGGNLWMDANKTSPY